MQRQETEPRNRNLFCTFSTVLWCAKTIGKESIQTLLVFTVLSASSCHNIETQMSKHMVEVGPGLGVTILMAVVGAVVVVAAAAAADR